MLGAVDQRCEGSFSTPTRSQEVRCAEVALNYPLGRESCPYSRPLSVCRLRIRLERFDSMKLCSYEIQLYKLFLIVGNTKVA